MIDLGKAYKTKSGRSVRILCTDGPEELYPVVGIISGSKYCENWTREGKLCAAQDFGFDSAEDLVEDLPRIAVERWINIYQPATDEFSVIVFNTENEAIVDSYEPVKVIACAIPFKWEGQA